ncbi:hypothetical protein DRJ25_05635 [Candidatus Woesearchaeota archaeon]|nr:MAG: hypothetical protein DRJ25_05635 [Candidatus Woesearchaeota archaeon]
MTKPTITAISRKEKRVEITFKRNSAFADLYLHLMDFLHTDFDPHLYQDEKGNIDKKLLLDEDYLHHYKQSGYSLEIFFGHKKVIVVFESDKALLQRFIDEIVKLSEWIKPE